VSILILSEQLDYHGTAVEWGLKKMGETVDWWERSLFPGGQSLSASISNTNDFRLSLSRLNHKSAYATECDFSIHPQSVSVNRDAYRTIWNRRGQVPRLSPSLEETDKVVARMESNFLLKSLLSAIVDRNKGALVVNLPAVIDLVNPKLYQLLIAKEIGFSIPKTIVSNDPDEIREFFGSVNGAMIAKQHLPFAWRLKSGAIAFPGTSRVFADQLESDFSLSGSPLTYQEYIEIEHELRVIVFGRSIFAISQKRGNPRVGDFCDVRWERLEGVHYDVNEQLSSMLFKYMEAMGLGYAAFDIAVTANDEFIFLESNECGQFLYLEELDPSIPVLDAFCKFLASGDANFRYQYGNRIAILSEFDTGEEATTFYKEFRAYEKESSKLSPFELQE